MVALLSNCTLMRLSEGGVVLQIVLRTLCYVRLHLGSLKLDLEWVFSWGRGRVHYHGLTVIFFFLTSLSLKYIFSC